PERRPGDPAAGREIDSADVRLNFLPEPGAHRQILARADVVLHVDAQLRLPNRDVGVAGVAGERRGPSGGVRVEARERERAGRVSELAASIRARVELHAGADRMAADRDVEIVGGEEDARAARPGELRA